ncbi:MAG TPA: hypothetical protein VFJ06_01630 [Halococcus sp.]|nr:hypothetical protein [Halococcus sp.]
MTDNTGNTETTASESEDDLVVLPNGATEEDVEFATPYRATVNETVEYGVFVRLAGEYPDDVGGLVHKSNLPTLYGPADFTGGDTLVVQLREHSEKGLSFEVVEVLDGAKGTSGVHGSPVRDYSPSPVAGEAAPDERSVSAPLNESRSIDGDTTTKSVETPETSTQGVEAITARLDAIEATLALDRPTVRTRVIDAGDDVILLRVLDSDGMVEMDHGEVVTVALHDADGRETGGNTDRQGGE